MTVAAAVAQNKPPRKADTDGKDIELDSGPDIVAVAVAAGKKVDTHTDIPPAAAGAVAEVEVDNNPHDQHNQHSPDQHRRTAPVAVVAAAQKDEEHTAREPAAAHQRQDSHHHQ